MKNQQYILLILIVMICFCISETYAADTSNSVVVILKSGDDPFWNQIKTGIEDASQELGISVTILFPETPYQSDEMTILAFEALKEAPSILIMAPSDSSMFSPVFTSASKDGIPVFLLESPLKNDKITGYVGSDNWAIGVIAADDLASLLNKEGTVAIISRNSPDPASLIRAESFEKQMETFYSGIDVYAFSPDNEIELALNIKSLLADNPDIKGIFATDNDSTLALGKILKELGLNGSVAVIGVDGGEEAKEYVTDGILQEVIVQDPYTIGYTAMETVNALIQGEDVSSETYIDMTTLTSDVPFTAVVSPSETTIPEVTPLSAPRDDGSDETLSYEQRLQAAAENYDFGSMSAQNADSHYSTVNQIAQQQAAISQAMSGPASTGATCSCKKPLLTRRS